MGEKYMWVFFIEVVYDCLCMGGIMFGDIDEVVFNFDLGLIFEGMFCCVICL